MATTKITDLTAYTDPVNTDVLPIVDITSDVTKKVSIANVMKNASLGTNALPGISFDGDPNTGVYSPGADQVAITTDGTARLTSSTTALTSTLPIDVPLGAQGTPSLTFTGDLNTGIYSPGADQVAISTGGSGKLFVDSNGRVGVGVTPSTTLLHVYTINPATVSAPTICLEGGSSGYGAGIDFASRTSVGGTLVSMAKITADGEAPWNTTASTQDAGLRFFTAENGSLNERLRITSTGALNFVGAGTAGSTQAVSFNGSAPVNSLVIDSSGRLGVGTSSPSTRLHVQDTTGNAQVRLTGPGGYTELYTDGNFYIQPNGSTKMVVQSGGNVGIGTTSPNNKLDIAAATANIGIDGTSNTYINFMKSAANIGYVADANWLFGDSSSDFGLRATSNLVFGIGANEKARLDSSGRLLVGTSSARGDFFNSSSYTPRVQIEGTDGTGTAMMSLVNNSTAGAAPYFILGLQKSGSSGGDTIVGDGNDLGYVTFQGNDGSEMVEAATIKCSVDGTPGSNDMPGRLVFSTTADGASSPTERMRIRNDGMTGMFSTDDTLQTRNSNGAGTTYALIRGIHSATGTVTGGTTSFIVYSNGNVENTNNSYTGISDIKLKENIVDANSQWNDLKALQVRKYNFKEGQTHTQIGLIAQEVELVSPGLVTESPDRDAEGNDLGTVTKSVNYSVLYMKAVKALQEAMERIEQLEAKVAALEAQ